MFSIEQLLEAFSSSHDVPQGAKEAMRAAVSELQSLRATVDAAHHRAGEAEKAAEGYREQLQGREADLMKLYQVVGVDTTLTHHEARQAKALENIHGLKRSNATRAIDLAMLQEHATGCYSDTGLFGSDGWIDRVITSIEQNAILRSDQAAACAETM